MSPKTYRALAVLAEYPNGVTPGEFAAALWPDSQSWRNRARSEIKRGAGVERRAGSYLSWLKQRGLVVEAGGAIPLFTLSDAGRDRHARRLDVERVRGAA